MDSILEHVNSLLAEILAEITSGTSQYIGVAKIIAGVGALILLHMTFSQIMSGKVEESINNFLKRIFLIGLGITFYGTFLSFVNTPLDLMSNSIKKVVAEDNDRTNNYFETYSFDNQNSFSNNEETDAEIKDLLNEADAVLGIQEEEDEGGISSVFMGVFNGTYQDNVRLWILEAFYKIIHWLGVIAIIILNVVRTFFLIVLSTFGIFVIAFSMYPGLENSFYQWLQKYINVYLWLPISYILQGLISRLFTYVNPDTASTVFTATPDEMVNASNNMLIALVGLCSIVAFATVPTLSSWLINAATNSLGSKVKGKAMDAGKTISKAGKTAAAAKSGGATAIAGAAISK